MRILLSVILLFSLTGCAKIAHLPQLLTLKAIGDNKELQKQYVKRENQNFEKLLEAVKNNHPKVTWWRLIRVFCTGFVDSYIKQQGFKAGTIGIVESLYQGFSMFITYVRLWEMQKNQKQQ